MACCATAAPCRSRQIASSSRSHARRAGPGRWRRRCAEVDTTKCTLCLSRVGACPASPLADNRDRPQLRFVEKNCAQCGLCVKTCPEGAIALAPRLWLADGGKARRRMRLLAEREPYRCVRCGKPFGTLRTIETMVAELAGCSALPGAAAERLKMCFDCRVIDIPSNANELRITDLCTYCRTDIRTGPPVRPPNQPPSRPSNGPATMTSAPIAFAAAGHGEELARADLAQLGLARMSGTLETEDHGACVFEAMRHLLAGDDAARCSLEQQRRVFCAHLQSWVEPLCDAVVANPRADAWLAVAEMTRAFVKAETLTFDMPEA